MGWFYENCVWNLPLCWSLSIDMIIVLCGKEDGLKLCKSLSKICAVNDGGKS